MKNRNPQRGFSLLELLVVVAIMLVIAAIAVPSLLAAKQSANASAAADGVHIIDAAATMYPNIWPAGTLTLANMAGASPCTPAANGACLVDQSFTATKGGYNYTAVASTVSGAFITATPVAGQGSVKYCMANGDHTIRYSNATPTTAVASELVCGGLNALGT